MNGFSTYFTGGRNLRTRQSSALGKLRLEILLRLKLYGNNFTLYLPSPSRTFCLPSPWFFCQQRKPFADRKRVAELVRSVRACQDVQVRLTPHALAHFYLSCWAHSLGRFYFIFNEAGSLIQDSSDTELFGHPQYISAALKMSFKYQSRETHSIINNLPVVSQ